MGVLLRCGRALLGCQGHPRLLELIRNNFQLSAMGSMASLEATVSARTRKLVQCEALLWGRGNG